MRQTELSVRPRTVLLTFVGAHMVNDFYSTVLPGFLPALAEEFNLDYVELGILSFAFILLTGVLQPVLGNLADRSGRRRWILVFGFTAGAIGFLAMAAAPSFWFIVGVSLLVGLGGATYHPQATAYIVTAYSDRPGRMLGIHGWGGSAGHFLAPAVVVLSVSVFSWRLAMASIAVPMFIAALVLRVKLEETPATPSATLRAALTPQLIVVAVSFGIVSMVGRSFLTFFVKMLVDEGWEETNAGVLLTVLLLVGAIAQPLGGWTYDRLGGRRVFTIAAGGTAILITVFAWTSGAVSLAAVTGIAFFHFSLFPVALAQASQLVPSTQTGAATGLVFGISGLMAAAILPAVGALAEVTGDIRVALAWQLPVVIAGLILSHFMLTSREQEPTANSSTSGPL